MDAPIIKSGKVYSHCDHCGKLVWVMTIHPHGDELWCYHCREADHGKESESDVQA